MDFQLTALLVVGILTCPEGGGSSAEAYLGTYGSVTESECNVELELLAGEKARILKTCRVEDGSHQEASRTVQATWSREGDRLTVEYDSHRDALEYDSSLSYRAFGRPGNGPGLRVLTPAGFGSLLRGFGPLWKRPLAEEKQQGLPNR